MILETERLILTPLESADAENLYPLMSDPDVMAYWETREIDDPVVVQALVDERRAGAAAGNGAAWSIRLIADASFLGFCELAEIDAGHHQAQVAILIRRPLWGQGYGPEAARVLLTHAASRGVRRVIARTHVGDARSETMLARLGFEKQHYLRGHIHRDGERRDCRVWGLAL